MTPRREVVKGHTPSQSTTGAQVKKKPRLGPVRRLENGLLNVDRKSGKHFKAIVQNARTPLLRLPAEIRNHIWELAIGSHEFTIKNFYIRERLEIYNGCIALLRVCRQAYADAALIPYKLGVFNLETMETIRWLNGFPRAARESIRTVIMPEKVPRAYFAVLGIFRFPDFPPPEVNDLCSTTFLPGLRQITVRSGFTGETWEEIMGSSPINVIGYFEKERKDVKIIVCSANP